MIRGGSRSVNDSRPAVRCHHAVNDESTLISIACAAASHPADRIGRAGSLGAFRGFWRRNGRVLVAGQTAGEEASASAEIYDPALGEFGEPLPAVMRRSSHAQVALPDGRVLLAGGETEPLQTTGAAEMLDPPTARASSLEALVDVVHGILNLKSNGRFVTILIGLPGRSPAEIDPLSVRLSIEELGSLPPVTCSKARGDHGADGTVSLMLKFSRADVIALTPEGETVSFLVAGALPHATPFAAADQVRVICPGKGGGGCGSDECKPHHSHH